MRSEISRRPARFDWGRSKIEPYADYRHDPLFSPARAALNQNATGLGRANQNIVRPFEPKCFTRLQWTCIADGIDSRNAGHQRELSDLGDRCAR